MVLYNRAQVKYRIDGYCWKKRRDGKTTREDHMKLKVQGIEVRGSLDVFVCVVVCGAIVSHPCEVPIQSDPWLEETDEI
jgi:hypothetical protein